MRRQSLLRGCRRSGSAPYPRVSRGCTAQRRLAKTVKDFLENAIELELHDTAAKIRMLRYRTGQFIAETDDIARLGLLARLDERFPMSRIEPAQQEYFDLAARLVAMPDEAGRHDAGIVEDQGISRYKEILEIIEMTMLYRFLHGIEYHEARCVARLDRHLGDAFLRQVVIKIG